MNLLFVLNCIIWGYIFNEDTILRKLGYKTLKDIIRDIENAELEEIVILNV